MFCVSESPSGVSQTKLKSLLKQRFSCVSEGVSKEGTQTLLKRIYTELYITEGGASEVNQEHEVRFIQAASRKRFTSEATILCEDLFKGPTPKLGPIREEPTMGQEQIRAKEIRRQSPPVKEQVIKKQRPVKNMFKKMTSGLWSVKTGKTKKPELNRTKEQPIRAEPTEEPIRAEQTEEPIRAELTEEPIRAELTEEQIRAEPTEEPIRAELTEEPIRAEPTEEPIRAEQTERQGPVRTVLTKGVAGIGKTLLTQKFSLDWAEGKANQDIQLLFPFTFRELNVLRDRQFSLMELLHHFFSEAKGVCSLEHLKVLFILDGLDECRLPLDFSRTRVLTEPTESASVEELLVNLIRGSLLPSARLWITTRPAAANQIPSECVSMVTEVQGFTDPQKEEYFRKRFRDEQQATAVISHIKKSLSLYIMCHMPVFCWILSSEKSCLIPSHRCTSTSSWSRPKSKALGKLAFEQLLKGNLIFYESDLSECGLDAAEIARYSGVFTQVFREEPGLYQDKVYCFIHLSVQEFLAALHVHQTFFSSGVNLLSTQRRRRRSLSEAAFYRSAVDRALESPNGHLDLFLRFLLGLSLPTNQSLLPVLLTQRKSSPEMNQKTIEYIKERIGEGLSTEGSFNLFHCLNELNDHTLVEQIQTNITEGRLSDMTPALWSALVFILLSSDTELEVFDLRKYSASPTAFLKLLYYNVLYFSLSDCSLSESSCGQLASVLGSEFSSLRNLDLSDNRLRDTGVEVLCSGLMSVNCRLETLRLVSCSLSQSCCGPLASVLCSESSSLRYLDLSYNKLLDSGVEQLCEGMKSAPCRLETLILRDCRLSEKCCGPLSTVLSSTSLTLLDLSINDLRDSGVELLCSGLKSATCRLQTLR
uniref:NACHT domain-containing protein n=1 Tax=Neogobius melanostomus TaxID=47308 RepID=A0A8C6U640_9GOBI